MSRHFNNIVKFRVVVRVEQQYQVKYTKIDTIFKTPKGKIIKRHKMFYF